MASPGRLLIFSGPSGAGKTTVLRQVLDRASVPLAVSVSATTRPPRPGEQDKVDYHFLSDAVFQQKREAGEFLECFEVFGHGYWYGTLKDGVSASLEAGQWVVLEIDVQGWQYVVQQYPDAISFFVRPKNLQVLERRLRDRATENEDTIQRRLQVARREWPHARDYTYEIINESIDQAVTEICQILERIGENPR